jgi:hypothetical protein
MLLHMTDSGSRLQIFIANTAEAFATLLERPGVSAERAAHEFDLSGRALLWGGRNKVVITPEPVAPELAAATKHLLGYDRLDLFSPASVSLRLCSDIARDKSLLGRLTDMLTMDPALELIPYAITAEFCELTDRLGLAFDRRAYLAALEIDSKAGFRRVCNGSNVSLPPGEICDDLTMTAAALHALLSSGRAAVVKVHNGESGWGLQAFNQPDGPPPDIEACVAILSQLFATDAVWAESPYIVEEYIDHDRKRPGFSPSGEATVTDAGVQFGYLCDQLIGRDGAFLGVRIGKSVEDSPFATQLTSETLAVGHLLYARAFRGTYDVDFIVDRADRIFAVESNVRLTGGTHVYGAARHVLVTAGNSSLFCPMTRCGTWDHRCLSAAYLICWTISC